MGNPPREQLLSTESQYADVQILARANKIIENRRRIIISLSAIIFLAVLPYFIFQQYGMTANFVLLYGLITVIWGAFGYTIYFYSGSQLSNMKYHGIGGHSAQGQMMILGEIYKDVVANSDGVQGDHFMDKPTNTVYLFGSIILLGFILIALGFFLP